MSEFHYSMGQNIQALHDWHDETHHLLEWADCPYSPCARLDKTFRWSK